METTRSASDISQIDLYDRHTVFNAEKSGDQSVRIFDVEHKSCLYITGLKIHSINNLFLCIYNKNTVCAVGFR